jgi:TPR repeat protein
MKANGPRWFLLLSLLGIASQSLAQQIEADRKLLAGIRAKAETGDSQSQLELGTALFLGRLGVGKDEVEAVKWYRKAAEQNLVKAQGCLGLCYETGHGVAKDDAEALKWYRKAGEQNYPYAQLVVRLFTASSLSAPRIGVSSRAGAAICFFTLGH